MQDVPYGYCHCGCGEKTTIAAYTKAALGHIKGQPVRYRPGHHRRKWGPTPYEARDAGYETPCWIWLWAKNRRGYGVRTKSPRSQLAHVQMWEAINGPVQDGLELDHLCRVPACVNPDHLEPVTHLENIRRGAAATLNSAQVADIRSRSSEDAAALAREFGVSRSRIYDLRNDPSTWKEVA